MPAGSRPSSLFALAAAAGAVLAAGAAVAEPRRFELDPEHLTVGFFVDHLGFASVLGRFREVEGGFVFDEATGELSDVRVVVATGSVSTDHEDRDEHLVSGDFLDSGAHADMTFRADGATRLDDRTFRVDGELTLLGETRPLTLEATWNRSGEYPFGGSPYVIGVSARGELDRSDFGMTYGVDNGWVGDRVEILIEFEARRQ